MWNALAGKCLKYIHSKCKCCKPFTTFHAALFVSQYTVHALHVLLLIKVLSSFVCVCPGGMVGGSALLRQCIIVQVSLVSSPSSLGSTWGITAREQRSWAVDISLITQSGGFSLGLSIPRGGWISYGVPPLGAVDRWKCQLLEPDALCSVWSNLKRGGRARTLISSRWEENGIRAIQS